MDRFVKILKSLVITNIVRRYELETEFFIESMRNEMYDLLLQSKETLNDLMNKFFNYFRFFGNSCLLIGKNCIRDK